MNTRVLIAGLLCLLLTDLFGEIRNGYEQHAAHFRTSLLAFRAMLAQPRSLSSTQRRRAASEVRFLMKRLTYYELTNTLLARFKKISPAIFSEINTLRDSQGRPVDVYVKFVPKEEAGFETTGILSLRPLAADTASCISEYGAGSVSIMIWIINDALRVLAHEFGHLSYVVPNLESYVAFYKKSYRRTSSHVNLGHLSADPSGKSARSFERRFRLDFASYIKKDRPKEPTPLALMAVMRRRVVDNMDNKDFVLVNARSGL